MKLADATYMDGFGDFIGRAGAFERHGVEKRGLAFRTSA
jgi:hypothetical protein